LIFLLALQLQTAAPTFTVPRVEADVTIDGALNEAAWQSAVRLTDFHQYEPVDGRSAEERTEVLVFYSPRAIHFGIIASAKDPSTIRATLADRDNIPSDDRVTIYLDTFDDRRRAFMFGVNPLGVQEDGVRTEGAVSAGSIFGGSVDLNPDYLFESKGQVTKEGYVVEVRIPFKSLRFPGSGPQRWGINVVRDVASTGYRDTWTDVRRASASFLAQSGRMEGIENVVRGVVTEVQPFVTATMTGAREPSSARFERDDIKPDAGANLRFGFPEFSLDATINPDFSQVESDVGLVTVNERFALFIPEKRPFFLEGIELFSTPNQLVYTRRIVEPLGGVKLTGKLGRYSVAYLSALDETRGRDALFNVARVRADFGGNSLVGVSVTDRRKGDTTNTVAAADVRYVFGRLYYLEGQAGGSWTRDSSSADTRPASVWRGEFDRTGRSWGFNYLVNAIEDDFESHAGFVPRSGIVEAHAFNRFTLYGGRGALVENFTFFGGPSRLWEYGSFPDASPVEGDELIGGYTIFRGGWRVNWGVFRQLVIFDRAQFSGLQNLVPPSVGGFIAYDGPSELSNLWGDSISVSTPVFSKWHATLGAARFATPIFFEGSEGDGSRLTASLTLRPTASIRVEALGVAVRIDRDRDGSEFARVIIPRLKLEYQPRRSLFFRVIGEWRDERRDALRDARTGEPLFFAGEPIPATEDKTLRADWLVSYEPSPGTVAFLGYGSTLEAPGGASWSHMRRSADGLFFKLAYQFRR
jgi:uncharacterized protein DUF5916/cellulose/xylan binding protein with CBM9 domain